MNFFEHQDRARSSTRTLVFLFVAAIITLIIVTTFLVVTVLTVKEGQNSQSTFDINFVTSDIFLLVSTGVISVVVLGTLFRFAQLKNGGRSVAEGLGGRLLNVQTKDADERKILNVVEEIAIASGMPVPEVYLLEDQAINAFAAGFRPQDAVIGVTRGCITQLNRDELQGVIAHEFSHIFNGDMRLNIRLIGWLYGITVIGLIGYYLMRGSSYSYGYRSSRDKNKTGIIFLGLGLLIVGYGGTFFGNLIKAAVSRQREFLADASAVQFTRNPEGISGALKKIGGYAGGTRLAAANASEISHMLFGESLRSGFFGLFATHPPLDERIQRLDPSWKGSKQASANGKKTEVSNARPEAVAGFASTYAADEVFTHIGELTSTNLEAAKQQLQNIPDVISSEAHSTLGASLLMFSLVVACSDENAATKQLRYLHENVGAESYNSFSSLYAQVLNQPRELYLTLVDIALPSLKQLSSEQYHTFMKHLQQLMLVDEQISMFEWCLFKILRYNLDRRAPRDEPLVDLDTCKSECQVLLSAIAQVGHNNVDTAGAAFDAGAQELGFTKTLELEWNKAEDIAILEQALGKLKNLRPLQKPRLLKAMVLCIQHDGVVSSEEGELLRAVAAVLDCPVPPLGSGR
ncbi:MAG: M48 family metallopeptidase [Pseudomonadota bacterium]